MNTPANHPMRSMVRLLMAMTALTLVCGCRMVDQTTFDSALKAKLYPPPKPVAKHEQPSGPPPLLTIHFADADSSVDYNDSLQLAVDQARARKPDVHFDVVTVIPAERSVDAELATAEQDNKDARDIAAAIERAGVDAGQIALGVRPESGVSGHDVRIYVH